MRNQTRNQEEAPTHARIRATGEVKEIQALRMDEDVAGTGDTALTLVFTDGTEEFAESCEPAPAPKADEFLRRPDGSIYGRR